MRKNILIIGSGSWGTALAIVASYSNNKVFLKTRKQQLCGKINNSRHSPYLENVIIPASIEAVMEFPIDIDLVIFAVPSEYLLEQLEEALSKLGLNIDIIIATKGMRNEGELFSAYFKRKWGIELIFLSGPNFAREVANGLKSACDIVCTDIKKAKKVADYLTSDHFEIKTGSDIVSIQIAGCYKNVLAIYSGYISVLGFGENYKAKICTDGINELGFICERLGGEKESIYSYSGIGDLILSSYSVESRNYRFGTFIAKQEKNNSILQQYSGVIEGIVASKSLPKLCKSFYNELTILPKVTSLIENFENKKL